MTETTGRLTRISHWRRESQDLDPGLCRQTAKYRTSTHLPGIASRSNTVGHDPGVYSEFATKGESHTFRAR